MFSFLRHLFVPHHSNSHRPKILHHDSLLIVALVFLMLTVFVVNVRKIAPDVLGIATNIHVSDLLSFTNQKRAEQGLSPLRLDDQLSGAAAAKGNDMMSKNYWAHNAPDGTTPWVFFQGAGYSYQYAGENLAKDFNDSAGVVDAWMNSPSHRENMLSNKYDDVGFAVVNGTLLGQETTLVVEEFGKRQGSAPSVPKIAANAPVPTPTVVSEQNLAIAPTTPVVVIPSEKPTITPTPLPLPTTTVAFTNAKGTDDTALVAGIRTIPLLNSVSVTKRIAIVTIVIIMVAFILDMIYIERKKLFRLVGHNADHIFFLAGAIILIVIIGGGIVL